MPTADDREHGPLEAYQWSAAKVDSTSRFVRQLGLVVGAVLLVCCIATLIWNTAIFGSQVSAIQRQQTANHADAAAVDARLNCEAMAFNNIISQLAAAEAAEAKHAVPPPFVYPKSC